MHLYRFVFITVAYEQGDKNTKSLPSSPIFEADLEASLW